MQYAARYEQVVALTKLERTEWAYGAASATLYEVQIVRVGIDEVSVVIDSRLQDSDHHVVIEQ
jgi:hypothetical protein